MYRFITLILALSIFPITVNAAKYKVIAHDYSKDGSVWAYTGNQKDNLVEIDGADIANYVKEIRIDVCEAIKPGSLTVNISVGTEGKLNATFLSLGSSFNAGIQVTVDCPD